MNSSLGPEQQESQQQKSEKGEEQTVISLSTSRPTDTKLSICLFICLYLFKSTRHQFFGGITQTKESSHNP